MHSVDNSSRLIIGLDAPCGTGKTFLLSTLLAAVRSNRKVALGTATRALQQTCCPMGRHCIVGARFHLPSKMTQHAASHNGTELQCSFASANWVVIDEVTMANRRVYEAVDHTFRDIREDDRPFGGIMMVLAGDWRQILPDVRGRGRPKLWMPA